MEGDFDGLHIAWEARAYSGKRWNPDDDLPGPISTTRGMCSADMERVYPSVGRCQLAGMLANLSVLARSYYAAEPRASAESIMTVFVYRLTHPERLDSERVARIHIDYYAGYASASIFMVGEQYAYINAVECKASDGLWDIVLRILRKLFSGPR